MRALEIVNEIEAFKEIEKLGGEIFLVGGIVRDHFINKESKDIDLIIRLLDLETIETVLKKHGRCSQEGENFPVLKFKPFGWKGEDIDVALPRKDRKATEEELKTLDKRSRGIVANCDPMLEIEEDLIRRDATINSIAMKLNGEIIDPFNGMKDIEDRILRATSLEAFIEDPLRIVRFLQFSSRFEFNIEPNTLVLIKEHKNKLKDITKERLLEEFNKIFFKGNIGLGFDLFKDLELDIEILGFKNTAFLQHIREIKTIGDFFFCVVSGDTDEKKEDIFKRCFKGSNNVSKEICAISMGVRDSSPNSLRNKKTALEMFRISKDSMNSGIITLFVKMAIEDIENKNLPKNSNELMISGKDLMELGINGKEIKISKDKLLDKVLLGEIKNTKEDLIKNS